MDDTLAAPDQFAHARYRTLGVGAGGPLPFPHDTLQFIVEEATRYRFQVIAFLSPDEGRRSFGIAALDALVLTSGHLASAASRLLGIPLVLLTDHAFPHANFDQLVLEKEAAGNAVAEYIASAGKASVGVVACEGEPSASLRGFLSGVSNYDLILAQEHMVSCASNRLAGVNAMREMLRTVTNLPQAIFCDEANIACGAFEALRAEGIRVPKDIWLIGQGQTTLTHSPFYGVTAVATDARVVAAELVGLVNRRTLEPGAPFALRRLRYDIVANATTEFFNIVRPVAGPLAE